MDINNNQQINTFVKGMNTDTSDAILSSDQYRYAENLRLVTNTEENTGELRLIEGDKLLHTFDGEILYITSIRKYIIVVLRKNNNWSVLVTTHNNYNQWETIFGPCNEPIWGNTFALCGVTRWESESNVKLYLTDNTGTHNIMIFNIDEDHWPSKKGKQIPTDIKTISGYVQGALPPPIVKVSSEYGTLKPARVQYAYRFYRYGGAATQLSSLSNILSLYKSDTQGYRYGETTSNAVDIDTQEPSDDTLNRIQIYRITYEQLGQIPSCALIKDEEIAKDGKYVDTGTDINAMSFDELSSLDTLSIKPKIIESKENYLFAADIQYEIDDVDEQFKNIDMCSISSGNAENRYIHQQFVNEDSEYNPEYWKKPVAGTPGGEGPHVDWEYAWKEIPVGPSINQDRKEQTRYLKHDETYRFGAILYDKQGRKSSVKWIADIRIPNFTADDISVSVLGGDVPTDVVYNIRQCYIKFTIHDMDPDVSAVQIVRCNRSINDTRVISQGIVGRPLKLYTFDADAIYGNDAIDSDDVTYINRILDGDTNELDQEVANEIKRVDDTLSKMKLAPSGYMTMQHIVVDNFERGGRDSMNLCKFAIPVDDVIQFASPEYVYAEDGMKDIISSYKDKLKLQHVLEYDTFNKTIEYDDQMFVRPWSWKYDTGYSVTTNSRPTQGLVRSIINRESIGGLHYHYAKLTFNDSQYDQNEAQMLMMHDTNDYNIVHEDSSNEINNFKTQSVQLDDDVVYGHLAFNHVLPAAVHNSNAIFYGNIDRSAYPEVPDWNSFSKDKNLRYLEDITTIGTYSYVNWSFILGTEQVAGEDKMMKDWLCGSDDGEYERDTYWKPIGTGGKCILFKMKDTVYPYLYTPNPHDYWGNGFPIHIANLVKPVHPYGGFDERSIKNSTYFQYGAYWNANDPKVVDFQYGDCSATLFTYNCAHNWHDVYYPCATKMGTVYMVPLESDVDIRGTYGDTLRNIDKRGWYVQDKASIFDDYSQQYDAYLYNPAYGQDSTLLPQATAVYTDISDGSFDSRVHFSEPKTNGEWIDNWTRFKAANFDDVDTRYGKITDLRLFKDKLVFWQNSATGVLRVNQRSVVQDENKVNLVLGNGGVLDGYDYVTTVYGMKKDQFVDAQSNTGLYWWDGNNKTILQLGEQVIPLSTQKSISNYINKHEEVDKPNLVYDNKYKELLCSVVEGGTLVYSEIISAFVSVYKFNPLFDAQVFEDTLVSNTSGLYKINESSQTSSLFGLDIKPLLKYIVNKDSSYNKVFDITTFGGRFYGGDDLKNLTFKFDTPLKQHSEGKGNQLITNREYDFRLTIPRNNNSLYGDRMRGKTMQCELSSSSSSTDFSIQYIITKYRVSWS